MCRLVYISNPEYIKDVKKLERFLSTLETENGGDGNGIGGLLKDGRFLVRKGVNYSVKDAVKDIVKHANIFKNGVIFHTRSATSGGITDKLCHPFLSLSKNVILAHNGHFFDAEHVLKMLKMLMPNKYAKYEYLSGYVYRNYYGIYNVFRDIYYHDSVLVSDTWVATELLSLLLKLHKKEDKAILAFKEFAGDGGNFFVQTKRGTVYLIIHRQSFEFTMIDGIVLAASSHIDMLIDALGIEEKDVVIETATDAVIKITKDYVEILRGKLRELDIKTDHDISVRIDKFEID